jgi:hypothetical protein
MMGVHADDVLRVIRENLVRTDTCGTMSEVTTEENPEMEWSSRDGRHVFYAMGRDWFRAFRITVEAIDPDEYEGDYDQPYVQRREWPMPPSPTHVLNPDGSISPIDDSATTT